MNIDDSKTQHATSPQLISDIMRMILSKLVFAPVVILEHVDGKSYDDEEILGFATVNNIDQKPSLSEIYMSIFPATLENQLFVVLKDGELNIGGVIYNSADEESIDDVHPLLKMFIENDRVVRFHHPV